MNKRALPILVLMFVSLFVFACAVGLVWVLSVDAKSMSEKIQASLTLGIPSALALLVLLWFGVGMDRFLARRKRSTGIGSLLTYLLLPAMLCVGLPALAGVAIYAVFNAPKGWQQLPAPPDPAVQVVGASELTVIIRTDSGSYFFCGISAPSECWDATNEPEQRMTGRGTEITAAPASAPPKGVISMLGLSYTDMGVEGQVHYAVLEDGSVWYLQKDNNKYEAGFASGLFLTLALIPAIAGLLVIYLGAGMSALLRWMAS